MAPAAGKANIFPKLAFEFIFTFSTLLIRPPEGRKTYRCGVQTGQENQQLYSRFNVLLSSKAVLPDGLYRPLNATTILRLPHFSRLRPTFLRKKTLRYQLSASDGCGRVFTPSTSTKTNNRYLTEKEKPITTSPRYYSFMLSGRRTPNLARIIPATTVSRSRPINFIVSAGGSCGMKLFFLVNIFPLQKDLCSI